jgi:hypothetical protein
MVLIDHLDFKIRDRNVKHVIFYALRNIITSLIYSEPMVLHEEQNLLCFASVSRI